MVFTKAGPVRLFANLITDRRCTCPCACKCLGLLQLGAAGTTGLLYFRMLKFNLREARAVSGIIVLLEENMTGSETDHNGGTGGENLWPDDTRDSAAETFSGHVETARLVSEILPTDASIIEFGCAAGLMGEQLALHGFEDITGLEQSAALQQIAESKSCYRSIRSHNLTQPLRDDVRYNAGVCVGVLGNSPVTAAHISYMTSVLDDDAPLFLTVNGQAWLDDDWPAELEAAQQADGFTIEYINTIAYLDSTIPDGRLVIVRNSDTGNEK